MGVVMFKLKKEAVPFFNKWLATKIAGVDFWNVRNISESALERVPDIHIITGHWSMTDNYTKNMCGWEGNKISTEMSEGHYHFTVVVPGVEFSFYNEMGSELNMRDLMDRMQNVIDEWKDEISNRPIEG
jgi:hypothetical protein